MVGGAALGLAAHRVPRRGVPQGADVGLPGERGAVTLPPYSSSEDSDLIEKSIS